MSDENKISPLPWVNHVVKTDCGHAHCIGNEEQIKEHKNRGKPNIPSYACLYVDYGKASREAEANAQFIVKACNSYHTNQQALADKDKRIAELELKQSNVMGRLIVAQDGAKSISERLFFDAVIAIFETEFKVKQLLEGE